MDSSSLDARDLENLWKALDAAIERKAFKPGELEVILPLNKKLGSFIIAYKAIKEKQAETHATE